MPLDAFCVGSAGGMMENIARPKIFAAMKMEWDTKTDGRALGLGMSWRFWISGAAKAQQERAAFGAIGGALVGIANSLIKLTEDPDNPNYSNDMEEWSRASEIVMFVDDANLEAIPLRVLRGLETLIGHEMVDPFRNRLDLLRKVNQDFGESEDSRHRIETLAAGLSEAATLLEKISARRRALEVVNRNKRDEYSKGISELLKNISRKRDEIDAKKNAGIISNDVFVLAAEELRKQEESVKSTTFDSWIQSSFPECANLLVADLEFAYLSLVPRTDDSDSLESNGGRLFFWIVVLLLISLIVWGVSIIPVPEELINRWGQ